VSYFYKGVWSMKGSIESIRDRIYELSLRIDKETYNPSSSKSEIKKLIKQKSKLEKQLEKITR
jgi:flagellar biosynthesis/type III secretory pathway chaperone